MIKHKMCTLEGVCDYISLKSESYLLLIMLEFDVFNEYSSRVKLL
jgi:hypothetical protein